MTEYHSQAHWNTRRRENTDVEWHCSYRTLRPLLRPYTSKKRCAALVLGSGASTFPEELYDGGVNDVMVVDFSKEATDDLHVRNADERSGLRIRQVDIGEGLEFPARQVGFDLVVDKGTIDCILSQRGGYPRAVTAIKAIHFYMKTPASLILVSHSPLSDRLDLFQSVHWHEIKVQIVRPAAIEDLISTKLHEEVLEDVPEGTEIPYEPGMAFVYSLIK